MKKKLFHILQIFSFNYFFQRRQNNKLLILMFHQVNDKNQRFYPGMSTKAFKELCLFIKNNYTVINPSEIESHFKKTKKSAAIISFDDGHYDIIEYVLPILKEYNLPFNVNIDTEILKTKKPQDFVRIYDVLNNTVIKKYQNKEFMTQPIHINKNTPMDTEREFTEVLSSLSSKDRRRFTDDFAKHAKMDEKQYSKMLSEDDLKTLSNYNVEFGSHSHTHAILTKLNNDEVNFELQHSKKILENIINKPINVIAYPNGVFNENVENIAKKLGYTILLQTNDKINSINILNNNFHNFTRINQYHQSAQEALAHIYGKTKILKSIKNKLKMLNLN